jgi:hypothetical protein
VVKVIEWYCFKIDFHKNPISALDI